MVEDLWRKMNTGGFAVAIKADVKKFNGGLFREVTALALEKAWIEQLIHAADADWSDVEPAIFGTLLERALDPRERHKLGAHYTPRAYVERLVDATVVEPLRGDWDAARAAAVAMANGGDLDGAKKQVLNFHRQLCDTKVLDPACGTGNFLYVALELMKQLEGEVLDQLEQFGDGEAMLEMDRFTVDPHQYLGLEINERAVAIAELVLWLGYLQWHYRTRGKVDPVEPILRDFKNIRHQDAALAKGKPVLRRDENGKPTSRWDGVTTKPNPMTGEEVPDEDARVEIEDFPDAIAATWPESDFIVGNPPFTGAKDIAANHSATASPRRCGNAIRRSPTVSIWMYWWDHAARLARTGKIRRFGFITTNSLSQTFNRRVLDAHLSGKKPLSLLFAIPDHPWVKAMDRRSARGAAAVRIAMTVGAAGHRPGRLGRVTSEAPGESDSAAVKIRWATGKVQSNLRLGADLGSAVELSSNGRLCNRGVVLHGRGFIVTSKQAEQLGLGRIEELNQYIRPYRNGKDLTGRSREVMVIDLFGLTAEEVRERFPDVYQWIAQRVKPERDHNPRASRRNNWWIFGEPISTFRPVLQGLKRYITTVETSKHRFFQFLDISVLPDNMLVNIGMEDAAILSILSSRVHVASKHRFFQFLDISVLPDNMLVNIGMEDAAILSILSSRVHVAWALAAGGRLGIGNDPRYQKSHCFDKFPFPVMSDTSRAVLAELGERLDRTRKDVLERLADLTMTGLYNVLERVREINRGGGGALTEAERDVFDRGLVGVIKELHDAIDAAAFDAYGWPHDLTDEQILERLVALNHERAAEEARGEIRWLRPEFQDPNHGKAVEPKKVQGELAVAPVSLTAAQRSLPAKLPERIAAVRDVLDEMGGIAELRGVAARFKGRKINPVRQALDALVALGIAEAADDLYALNEGPTTRRAA